jgi:hypothetical protein
MGNPGRLRGQTPGANVDLTKSDSKPSAQHSQVIKRRISGPEWVAVVTGRRRYAVPTWRIHSTALGRCP